MTVRAERDSTIGQALVVKSWVANLVPTVKIETASETPQVGQVEVTPQELDASSLPQPIKDYLVAGEPDRPFQIRLLNSPTEGVIWMGRSKAGQETVALIVRTNTREIFRGERVEISVVPFQYPNESEEVYNSRLQKLGLLEPYQQLQAHIASVGKQEIVNEVFSFVRNIIDNRTTSPTP